MIRLLSIIIWAILFAVLMADAGMAAEKVPEFNLDKTCHAAGATGVRPGTNSRDDSACKRDEHDAHDKLKQGWDQFTADDRLHCERLSALGGSPSYVELLTCLELAKHANNLPTDVQTAGQGGKSLKP
jgi:hypothetical protein